MSSPRSSSVSGFSVSSSDRDSSGEITENEGFSVVAAISTTQPFSTPGQQRVLLRLRESVDLVEEEDRGLAVQVALGQRLLHDLAHIPDSGRHRGEFDEAPARGAGHGLGERRLAGAGRAPEDHRGRPGRGIRIRERHQRRARAKQMSLARDLGEGHRTHPHRERCLPLEKRGGWAHTPRGSARRASGAWRGSGDRHGFQASRGIRPGGRSGLDGRVRGHRINPARERPEDKGDLVAAGGKDRGTRDARERSRIYQARQKFHDDQARRRRRDNLLAGIVGGALILAVVGGQVAYFTMGPGAPEPAPAPSVSPTSTPAPTESPSTAPSADSDSDSLSGWRRPY